MGSAPESLFPSRSSLTNPFEGAAEGRRGCSTSPSSFNPPALRPFPTHVPTTGPGWRLLSGGRALRSRGRAQGSRGEEPRAAGPCEGFPAAGRDMAAPCFLGWDFSTQQVPRPPPSPPRAEITSLQLR